MYLLVQYLHECIVAPLATWVSFIRLMRHNVPVECAASPTRPPSSAGTVCSPRYPATSTGTSTSSGSTRHDGWDPAARVVRHILMADVTNATCRSLG